MKTWVQGGGNSGEPRNGSARKRKSGVGSSEQGGANYNAVISRWQKVTHLKDLLFEAFSFVCSMKVFDFCSLKTMLFT